MVHILQEQLKYMHGLVIASIIKSVMKLLTKFQRPTVETWEPISNFITHLAVRVMVYPRGNLS